MRKCQDSIASVLFGAKERIDVDRGLAEVRAGRPVCVAGADQAILALPVEGLTGERLASFSALSPRHPPRLVISSQRAVTMGFKAALPTALPLPAGTTAETVHAVVSAANVEWPLIGAPAGRAEAAAVDLVKLAQQLPAVLAVDAKTAAPAIEDLKPVTVDATAVAQFRASLIRSLTIAGDAQVPLASGVQTRFVVFRDGTGNSSVAVMIGKPDLSAPVPVRLHSACFTGDVFGSRRCDCGEQLKLALAHIEAAGGGVILYLAQEGRGLGLANKMRAYRLQDLGLDTVDANTTLGFEDDERDYGIAARMLELLGIARVQLLTNNPAKLAGLTKAGIKIASRMPLQARANADNRRYLAAKASRAGHQLDQFLALFDGAGEAAVSPLADKLESRA
ncbi:MAG: GTP cyclohydrolase II [Variibacter sp.]|nr:GTP cyclohydrolase II [Variibacter sp.]